MEDRSKILASTVDTLFLKIDSLNLNNLTLKDIYMLISSYGTGRNDNPRILETLFNKVYEDLGNASIEEIVNCIYTSARLYIGVNDDEYTNVKIYVERGLEVLKFKDFGDEQLGVNLIWSLSILKIESSLVEILFKNFEEGFKEIKGMHLRQLYQSYTLNPSLKVSNEFKIRMEKEWIKEKRREKKSSNKHLEISKTLDLMGIKHVNEFEEDVDVHITLTSPNSAFKYTRDLIKPTEDMNDGDKKIALEFDGPSHFTRYSNRSLGHTHLKYNLLSSSYYVIRIPYYVWERIPFWASMERQRYLQRLLMTDEVLVFSGKDVSEYKKLGGGVTRFD